MIWFVFPYLSPSGLKTKQALSVTECVESKVFAAATLRLGDPSKKEVIHGKTCEDDPRWKELYNTILAALNIKQPDSL
jgi:hypothetical protein